MANRRASQKSQQFTSQVIAESIDRIQRSFHGDGGDYPIKQESNFIGSVTPLEDKIAITFPGNRNNTAEEVTFAKARYESLHQVGFEGQVYKEIHESFQKIYKQVYQIVIECLASNKRDHVDFIIEGHSRGAGMAVLFAGYMRTQFPTSSFSILTYSPMAILDQEAADNYTALIGEENHLSFIAKGDPFPSLFEKIGFHHSGKKITFSPESSHFYQKNVAEEQYPYLTGTALVSLFIRTVLGSKAWNAHMLETYRDVAPTLMPC